MKKDQIKNTHKRIDFKDYSTSIFTTNKKKLGFPVPIRVWLKEDTGYGKVKEAFQSQAAKKYFHTEPIMHLLDEHKNGVKDNSRKIWTIYSFLVWYQVFFEEKKEEAA